VKRVPAFAPAGPEAQVRVLVAEVAAFDARADPSYVLADFIAFHARQVLHAFRRRTLREIEQRLSRRIQLPLRSQPPELCHIAAAASNWASDHLKQAEVRGWAREQRAEREAMV
jgi:hypothetical protein